MKSVLVVSRPTILKAQAAISSCEACSERAGILFDWIVDEVTGRDAVTTDYFLSEPATCPNCHGQVLEDTLVEPVKMDTSLRRYPSLFRG
jgi:hypothetical protein